MSQDKIERGADLHILPSKKGGSNPGAWCERYGERYMVKIEVTDEVRGVVNEVMANRFYGHLGQVMTPEVSIGLFPTELVKDVVTQFLSNANDGEIEPSLLAEYSRPRLYDFDDDEMYGAGLVSKATDGYFNLGEDIVDTIERDRILPEFYRHEDIGIPIRGLAQAAALARVLGDNDWIGGSGGNLGLVIAGEDNSRYAQVVMVDPGQAFSLEYQGAFQSRDFGISVQGNPTLIQFDRLSDAHKIEFLATLNSLNTLSDEGLKTALTGGTTLEKEISYFLERTAFAEQAPTYVDEMVSKIRANITAQCQLYNADIVHYHIGDEVAEETHQAETKNLKTDSKDLMVDYKRNFHKSLKSEPDESEYIISPKH